MSKWPAAAVFVLCAHFQASYLVPLDQPAQQTFGGLLKWFWPWADGDSGPLGVTTVASGFPVAGFFVAVTSAALFLCAAAAIAGIKMPYRWWRPSGGAGAALSLFLMAMFFGPTKLIPMALDVAVLRAVWANRAPGPAWPFRSRPAR